MKKSEIKSRGNVYYAANRFGYKVMVMCGNSVIEEYTAGNTYADSQTFISPYGIGAVHPNKLRVWAKQTAQEIAEEHGIPKERVFYDTDLTAELEELGEVC